MAENNVWKQLNEAKDDLVKRAQALKQAFIQMPGGATPSDPAAGGAPADPAAGMPPEAAGMPPGGDPAAMGGMPPDMDPAMLAAMGGAPVGVDPATAGMIGGGVPPADPAAAGAAGAIAGGAAAGTPEPTLTLTLSQLWDVVTKVLGLAKKIGANGQGVAPEAAPAQPSGEVNQDAIKAAVIEALGDMGAMKTAQAPAATPNVIAKNPLTSKHKNPLEKILKRRVGGLNAMPKTQSGNPPMRTMPKTPSDKVQMRTLGGAKPQSSWSRFSK